MAGEGSEGTVLTPAQPALDVLLGPETSWRTSRLLQFCCAVSVFKYLSAFLARILGKCWGTQRLREYCKSCFCFRGIDPDDGRICLDVFAFLVPVGLTLHQYDPRTAALKERELNQHKNHAALQHERSQPAANIVIQTVHDFLFCRTFLTWLNKAQRAQRPW